MEDKNELQSKANPVVLLRIPSQKLGLIEPLSTLPRKSKGTLHVDRGNSKKQLKLDKMK